ncbi:unnamed protein product [marine sediment metagenome]|uniref:Uncharacterized protein n=1 Tax=marine sediment metagenome TaxID=412755 RepID=X1LJL7_9ZZZZ
MNDRFKKKAVRRHYKIYNYTNPDKRVLLNQDPFFGSQAECVLRGWYLAKPRTNLLILKLVLTSPKPKPRTENGLTGRV